jgi:hypothetical protein
MSRNKRYNFPEILKETVVLKIGDVLECLDDDSDDEDLGMSGIVLKGSKGLIVGEKYIITSVDVSQIPKQMNHGSKTWTDDEYEKVKFYWHICGLTSMDRKTEILRIVIGDKFKKLD